MSVHKIYWKVRDALITLGIVEAPKVALRRQPAGSVRSRLTGRGSSRRMRRMSLPQPLRL